ncbi:MAG: homoserine O-acetyltransferase MetX [Deltaproteobacteria bacterium]
MKKNELGIAETKLFTFEGVKLDNGTRLGPVTLAYETYGQLNPQRSNAILILHALSGDAHAAGFQQGAKKPGWWDAMIGPGKAFDTDKYFIICSNVLGGCRGSTGPSSGNPKTGRPYCLDFPLITLWDMVRCQKTLVNSFGVDKLLCVAGGSMGGMQTLAWLAKYPESIRGAVPIATALKHSPQQIAFNEVGRQAIMSDPHWKNGDYYGGPMPAKGLALARMIGHITYMSDVSMGDKFGRQRKNPGQAFTFTAADFEVEGYLHYHGDNFVKRFDANSYLYITKAMDNFDASLGGKLHEVLRGVKARVMVLAFKSDWLYPAYQSKEIVRACKLSGVEASYCEIDSTYGHDAFLLETEEETHLISHFLKRLYNEAG